MGSPSANSGAQWEMPPKRLAPRNGGSPRGNWPHLVKWPHTMFPWGATQGLPSVTAARVGGRGPTRFKCTLSAEITQILHHLNSSHPLKEQLYLSRD